MQNTATHNRMLSVGITGGIGSGKTTACTLFESLGVPVYYADERAKYLMQHEHYLIDELKKAFGEDIYFNGTLQREVLASKVFGSAQKVQLLNSLVHPAVFRDNERWMEEQRAKQLPYCLKEAALLIESGSYKKLDKLIVVTAPEELRIQRVMQREQTTRDKVTQRMHHQMPEEEKVKAADFVINNTGNIAELRAQVEKVHQQIIALHHNQPA